MSMNVFIVATRQVEFKQKNGSTGKSEQHVTFNAVQTPTNVTYQIVKSDNPIQAYIDYVRSIGRVERMDVYADDDPFGHGDPVGYEEYNWAEDHIVEFNNWLARMDEENYTVTIEVI